MSGILTFLEGYLTGNAWEDLCVQCYRLSSFDGIEISEESLLPTIDGFDILSDVAEVAVVAIP